MTIQDFDIDLRLQSKTDGKVRAIADVELKLGEGGGVRIHGFRVMESDGKGFWIAPPSRRGTSKYFRIVELTGPIKSLLDTAILKQFQQARKSADEA